MTWFSFASDFRNKPTIPIHYSYLLISLSSLGRSVTIVQFLFPLFAFSFSKNSTKMKQNSCSNLHTIPKSEHFHNFHFSSKVGQNLFSTLLRSFGLKRNLKYKKKSLSENFILHPSTLLTLAFFLAVTMLIKYEMNQPSPLQAFVSTNKCHHRGAV